MKFSVTSHAFLSGISPAINVADSSAGKEYADSGLVSITAKKTELLASANNGNVAIISDILKEDGINYTVISDSLDFSVTLNAKDLNNSILSFDKKEVIEVEFSGNEIIFVPQSDKEKIQTVPCEVRQVDLPPISQKSLKEASLNKEALLTAINNTLFAIGFERKFQPDLLYWRLSVADKSITVFTGDGARFPVYKIEGDKVATSAKAFNFYFHKDQNAAFIKILSSIESNDVVIKEYVKENSSDSTPDQFIVILGNVTMILIGHGFPTKNMDESKFLSRVNNYKFVTKVEDWEKELSGVYATFNDDVKKQTQVHTTLLSFDISKNNIVLKSESSMRSVRKVPLADSYTSDTNTLVEFRVITSLLKDCIKYGKGYIQMELVDGNKPMLVRYFASDKISDVVKKDDPKFGTTDTYALILASYNKKS